MTDSVQQNVEESGNILHSHCMQLDKNPGHAVNI